MVALPSADLGCDRAERGGERVAHMKPRLHDPERDAGHASALRPCIRPRNNEGTIGFRNGDHASPRCKNAGFAGVEVVGPQVEISRKSPLHPTRTTCASPFPPSSRKTSSDSATKTPSQSTARAETVFLYKCKLYTLTYGGRPLVGLVHHDMHPCARVAITTTIKS